VDSRLRGNDTGNVVMFSLLWQRACCSHYSNLSTRNERVGGNPAKPFRSSGMSVQEYRFCPVLATFLCFWRRTGFPPSREWRVGYHMREIATVPLQGLKICNPYAASGRGVLQGRTCVFARCWGVLALWADT